MDYYTISYHSGIHKLGLARQSKSNDLYYKQERIYFSQ